MAKHSKSKATAVNASAPSKSKAAIVNPDAPTIAVGTNFFRQKYLFAFASQQEVRQHLGTQAAKDDAAGGAYATS